MSLFDQRNQKVDTQFNIAGNVSVFSGDLSMGLFGGNGSGVFAAIEAELAPALEKEIEEIRAALRKGDLDAAQARLDQVEENPRLFKLVPEVYRARLLHMRAGLLLERTGDHKAAEGLVAEAARIDPSADQRRIRAQIAYAADPSSTGVVAALAILGASTAVDDILVRCGFLLEAGKVEEAEQELQGLADRAPDHPERLRLKAHAFLERGQVAEAEKAINAALSLQPEWVATRHTQAVIWYVGALSPVLRRKSLSLEPANLLLVRTDDTSLTKLRDAASYFEREAAASSGVRKGSAQSLQLACLGQDPGRQQEASALCQRLLEMDPANALAVMWVAIRNYEIDLSRSVQALQRRFKEEPATISVVVALAWAFMAKENARAAFQLLDRARGAFTGPELELLDSLHLHAMTQSPMSSKVVASLRRLAGSAATALKRSVVLEALTGVDDDPEPLLTHLDATYKETHDPLDVLEYCRALWRYKRCSRGANLIGDVVTGCGTAAVVTFGASFLFEAGSYMDCSMLLEAHCAWFPNEELPPELRRMRIRCLLLMGDLSRATEEAQALTVVDRSTLTLSLLAQCYIALGDRTLLIGVARELKDRQDLAKATALDLARRIHHSDDRLAKELWRIGARPTLPDAYVGLALEVGIRLELDAETGGLMARMHSLVAQGQSGIELVALGRFVELAKQHAQSVVDVETLYRRGEIPVHRLPRNGSLLERYHEIVAGLTAPALAGPALLYARHGSRSLPIIPMGTKLNWHLYLDSTALLLAADLNLLTVVEMAFGTLHVPSTLPLILQELAEQVRHHQPAQIETLRRIVRLTQTYNKGHPLLVTLPSQNTLAEIDPLLAGRVDALWSSQYMIARKNECYLLDNYPDGWEKAPDLRAALERIVVTPLALVPALEQAQLLPKNRAKEVIARLGIAVSGATRPCPPRGAKVFCPGPMAQLLSGINLLEPICQYYKLYISQETASACQRALLNDDEAERTAAWVDDLGAHVAECLMSGRYMPVVTEDRPSADSDDSLIDIALENLLSVRGNPGDVLWVDDRFVTRYVSTGSLPIIGINEVLLALLAGGALDSDAYYGVLHRLRERNMRFIPISSEELIYHLIRADVRDAHLVETPELAVMRRYAAACRMDSAFLQPAFLPNGDPNPNGEDAFLLGLDHAVDMALTQLWTKVDDDTTVMRATWLFNSIWLESAADSGFDPDMARSYASIAGRWANLLLRSAFQVTESEDASHRLDGYRMWLASRFASRLESDPALLGWVTEIVVRALLVVWKDAKDTVQARKRLTEILDRVPEPLSTAVRQNEQLVRSTALGGYAAGAARFHASELEQALRDAINGRPATITTLDGDGIYQAEALTDVHGNAIVVFRQAASGEEQLFGGPDVQLLVEADDAWRALLLRNRHWFDCAPEEQARLIEAIMMIDDLNYRRETVRRRLQVSLSIYYERLGEALKESMWQEVPDLFPADADALIQHLRLEMSDDAGFPDALAAATTRLLQDEDLKVAIERVRGMPVRLPDTLVTACSALPKSDRAALLDSLATGQMSPLARVQHLALIAQCMGPKSSELAALGEQVRSAAFIAETELFLGLARWVDNMLPTLFEVHKWPSWLRLALCWFHADRLWTLWLNAGLMPDLLRARFRQEGSLLRQYLEETVPPFSLDTDVAAPRRVTSAGFCLSSLIYVLGDNAWEIVASDALSDDERLQLWREVSGGSNVLGSFLDDARLCRWFGFTPEGSDFDLPYQISLMVQDVLSRLPGQPAAWRELRFLSESQPLDAATAMVLWSVVQATDFIELWQLHPDAAATALLLTTRQLASTPDSTTIEYVESQLVACARLLNEGAPAAQADQTGMEERSAIWSQAPLIVFQAALYLSNAGATGANERVQRFMDLITALVNADPQLATEYRTIIVNGSVNMGVITAQRLLPLVLFLRSQE